MKRFLFCFALVGSLHAAPLPLEESTVVETVNDVTHIAMPSGQTEPAIVRLRLQAPDQLRTGRRSRAELEAPDGTITRLGANTLFAFDRATRSLELDRGSLLFHSPTGAQLVGRLQAQVRDRGLGLPGGHGDVGDVVDGFDDG